MNVKNMRLNHVVISLRVACVISSVDQLDVGQVKGTIYKNLLTRMK